MWNNNINSFRKLLYGRNTKSFIRFQKSKHNLLTIFDRIICTRNSNYRRRRLHHRAFGIYDDQLVSKVEGLKKVEGSVSGIKYQRFYEDLYIRYFGNSIQVVLPNPMKQATLTPNACKNFYPSHHCQVPA